MTNIDKYRGFSSEYDYTAFSVVRVHPAKLRELGGRNAWVKISSKNGCIYRMALGGKLSPGFTHKAMEIDYDSRLELDIASANHRDENGFYQCDLSLAAASWKEKIMAHWRHPSPAYRVPMQLGIIGFVLGVVGLILGILGFA